MNLTALRPLATVAVTALAAARLSRFMTTDTLGEWLIVRPLRTRAQRYEAHYRATTAEVLAEVEATHERHPHPALAELIERTRADLEDEEPMSIPARAASGLECPFCVGFWLGGVALVGAAVAQHHATPRPLAAAIKLVGGSLALNYVVGHISSRLDADS